MTKEEMFNMMNSTMVMHLATVEDGQPHVRGMLLYRADENGIIFHTGSFKDVFKQIEKNKVDYEKVNHKLDRFRSKSIRFLMDSLIAK